MIETQIIHEDNRPVAVILDYNEYMRLKECEQDIKDYESAVKIKNSNREWTDHEDLKKELDL